MDIRGDLIPATADELLAKIDQATRERELQELLRHVESPDWVTAAALWLTGLVVVGFWVAVVLLLVSL